ncbi:receptor-like protein 6 [Tripterygium wilfordii]|uniref:receptor-like protein 6 n=1 Tax=Tripterygium wilfordii TaxID=458696 RepID=UPI0018F80CCE|nr:receptor-like protein 6 [Tripterygium wilfordii]
MQAFESVGRPGIPCHYFLPFFVFINDFSLPLLLYLIIPMAFSLLNLLRFMSLISFLSLFLAIHLSSFIPPPCHRKECLALLQFKQSFFLNKSASIDPSAFPKVNSWRQNGENCDCCLWDGVECDENTGHVIGLDLSSSCLYGPISSNSSLFNLVHLQRLNLADNDFNRSRIPSEFRFFLQLRHLNLSSSGFHGQIPSEISELSRLTSLDITGGADQSDGRLLELKSHDLDRLVQNLTRIQELFLDNVGIYTAIPDNIANLSSLTSLHLGNCGHHGRFPVRVFELPNLQDLSVGMNENLFGYLPEFHRRAPPLKRLWLEGTNFSGRLPDSIGSLRSLTLLNLALCNFRGPLPSSLGNLTNLTFLKIRNNNFSGQIPSSFANLTQLSSLSLSENDLSCGSLSWLVKLTKITHLSLGQCNITGEIPRALANLTQLDTLILDSNHLSGRIPHWLANLTRLSVLSFESNELHGPVPDLISKLVNLDHLNFKNNHLSGIVNLDQFFTLKRLSYLDISYNNFSLLNETSPNATRSKWRILGLASCNLRDFPTFLRYQDKLEYLDLTGNKIHGQIPSWFWDIGRETLQSIKLGFNFFTSFDQSSSISHFSRLQVLQLQSNKLKGPLPLPPPSIVEYSVSNNSFTGEISSMFCNLPHLYSLDLSFNNLSGMLPQCLFKLGNNLAVLNLDSNFFRGTIPETFVNESKLKMIVLSHNKLQGRIPISIANHTMLEILDLGHNKIRDTFPSFLGALPNLQVLILRCNKLFGAIGKPATSSEFSMLRILDLSFNYFTGMLPSEYFRIWNGMRIFDVHEFSYMEVSKTVRIPDYLTIVKIGIPLSLVTKGIDVVYVKIPNAFVAIDLSSNRFEGEIPESITTLKKLLSLNLSKNRLSGRIPSLIENLTELESLDLSNNMLSGEIPQQMTQLTFLSFFNASHNNLSGHIPQGKQFDTFENSSFEDNLGLCGKPLSKMCGNAGESPPSPPTSEDDEGSGGSSVYIQWMVTAIGYGSGLVVGVVFGLRFTTWKHEWFVETFSRRQPKRRGNRRGRRVWSS